MLFASWRQIDKKEKSAIAVALFVELDVSVLQALHPTWLIGGSTYSRQAAADGYSLEMKPLNTTLEETYALQAGDAIEVSLAQLSGELTITIGQKGQMPIYEGRNPRLNSFRVTAPVEGDYLLSVTGKQARGSISFRILRDAEQD